MLRLTLNKNDYVTIGDDITVKYNKNNGEGTFSIAIAAPRDLKIQRKNLYEANLQEMADAGDLEAEFLLTLLEDESEERQKISASRKEKQQFHKNKVRI